MANSSDWFKAVAQRIDRVVRAARRAIAKAIEPKPVPRWGAHIDLSLKGARALRDKLGVDENSYLFVSGATWADCRANFLYTALDEVHKCAIYLLRLAEYLDGPDVSPHGDWISRLAFAQLIEEQSARERRLIELLVTLVLFDSTNEQDFYRDFLLLTDLDRLLSANSDLKEFHGAPSLNVEFSIEQDLLALRKIEETLDLSSAWYRKHGGPLPEREGLRPGGLLTSVRARVRKALPRMTDHERVLVGLSYSGYGQASERVHYTPSPQDYRFRQGQEEGKAFGLGHLNLAILDRCHRILGRPDVPLLNRIAASLEQTEPTDFVRRATLRNCRVGDFVLAGGDLAEVLAIQETAYGYRSYQVRYLAERPIPEIPEDWFPARFIRLLYTKEEFHKHMKDTVTRGVLPEDLGRRIGQLNEVELQPLLRASLIKTWHAGLRDWARSQGYR